MLEFYTQFFGIMLQKLINLNSKIDDLQKQKTKWIAGSGKKVGISEEVDLLQSRVKEYELKAAIWDQERKKYIDKRRGKAQQLRDPESKLRGFSFEKDSLEGDLKKAEKEIARWKDRAEARH